MRQTAIHGILSRAAPKPLTSPSGAVVCCGPVTEFMAGVGLSLHQCNTCKEVTAVYDCCRHRLAMGELEAAPDICPNCGKDRRPEMIDPMVGGRGITKEFEEMSPREKLEAVSLSYDDGGPNIPQWVKDAAKAGADEIECLRAELKDLGSFGQSAGDVYDAGHGISYKIVGIYFRGTRWLIDGYGKDEKKFREGNADDSELAKCKLVSRMEDL